MFPNFTGSSRKRNVNLGGNKSNNPFTGTGRSSASASGASKTVANAQAERQHRQQERDRLKAAQRLQRVWRGHRVRSKVRTARRQQLDQLYGPQGPQDADSRLIHALPLVMAVYQPSAAEDHQRLRRVAQDLVDNDFGIFTSGAIPHIRLRKLARLLVSALERLDQKDLTSEAPIFLSAIDGTLQLGPQSLEPVLTRYYKVLAKCCHDTGSPREFVDLIRGAVVTPLLGAHITRAATLIAYREFALAFLSQRDLPLFENHIDKFAPEINLELLSEAMLDPPPQEPKTPEAQSAFLWLLAHFIALRKAKPQQTLYLLGLKTVYRLLCTSSNLIRERFSRSSSRGTSSDPESVERNRERLAPYVSGCLESLIDQNEIASLLDELTRNHSESPGAELEAASFLAGYVLTLVYCFPSLSDDIRMRLYLADVSTHRGPEPTVKFFWNAVVKTSMFSQIASSSGAAKEIFQNHRPPPQDQTTRSDSNWDREWRTILLFLELYVFVLRLTDDDDFFAGLTQAGPGPVSRLRLCGLTKTNLSQLSLFLKHLAFTLFYDTPESLLGASKKQDRTAAKETYTITAGIDFYACRNLVTMAMKMLYERDSRRPFLPDGHWLMTSKFDMVGFQVAVLLEEERRREIKEADSDDESNPDTMDVDGPQQFSSRLRSRDAYLAEHRPKLEVLENMPFTIPFTERVKIFRSFVRLDMEQRRGGDVNPDQWRLRRHHHGHGLHMDPLSKHRATISRDNLFEDAKQAFWGLGDGLKEPIQIEFVDQYGMAEAGIDGGGVTKEFLTSVTQEAFTKFDLFIANKQNAYYPNPYFMDQRNALLRRQGVEAGSAEWRKAQETLVSQYDFLGRIIGKCMYEGILLDITFAGFFLLKWASASSNSYRANINDLRELDEELYQGMMRLKNYPGDVRDWGLDFTIDDEISPPGEPLRTVTRNLMPNGDKVPVTNENKPLYISYVARHRLMSQPHQVTHAFLRGLGMIIRPTWLSMFNQKELQRLVGGDSSDIDVDDLQNHTEYSGVYDDKHPTVRFFWQAMRDFSDGERREVLKFVTSTPRAPLLGFSQLNPPFSIRDGGGDDTRLPSASTCVNLLKLPRYSTLEQLRLKLLQAVKSGAGFDLS
ncbi:hypothetical protein QBC39DRAFT_167566 [Podospora conica]|nr:hypothetical protein QBC39DRAFT_167566 [Schizothecium conicum]